MRINHPLAALAAAIVLGITGPLLRGAPLLSTIADVHHTPEQPRAGDPITISARVPADATTVILHYQVVDPGHYIDLKDPAYKTNWVDLPMVSSEIGPATKPGEVVYSIRLPSSLQIHRRLVRYRLSALTPAGRSLTAPDSEDSEPNYAYFVYDGVPGWSGAIDPKSRDPSKSRVINFSPGTMRSVQAYHLISKATSIENATWHEQSGGKEYKYTGTLVVQGKVYDHVRLRARGGVWRYAMGKNMWKIDFNKGHLLEARDDYGRPYRVQWGKLNLRACIQQGDYGRRGEQGMFEAVGFRLFSLAQVPAPNTHWIQLRIIDEADENPADQYRGDFWGLYLAIENEDGHFLEEHGLPSGNLYKMESGGGSLSHHGRGAVTNNSDLNRFLSSYNNRNPAETWWRTNLDLPRYYSYRSILESIHHYDVGEGKNYDYYLNPQTGQWTVIPWDIDLTWADHMYGNGGEPFNGRVLSRPVFKVEYQNRLREIRDLLFNVEQAGQLIDECAALIADPAGGPSLVDADRAKWDYHPVMAMGGKAGQGLFYQAAPSHDFRGMVRLMKLYVKTRGAWIDSNLLADPRVPATPAATYVGAPEFPANRLEFRCSDFRGANAFAAMKWRLGEVMAPKSSLPSKGPRPYEIASVWESNELMNFTPEIILPANTTKVGHTYRARVRLKDATGRWSHWSPPVEFTAGAPLP